jgi:hypothetical protein
VTIVCVDKRPQPPSQLCSWWVSQYIQFVHQQHNPLGAELQQVMLKHVLGTRHIRCVTRDDLSEDDTKKCVKLRFRGSLSEARLTIESDIDGVEPFLYEVIV